MHTGLDHFTPFTVLVADVLRDAGGNPSKGSLTITAPAFTSNDGQSIAAVNLKVNFDGIFSQPLVPNPTADPDHHYTVAFKTSTGGQ